MIAPIGKAFRRVTKSCKLTRHAKFLEMLPQIQEQARIAFRGMRPEAQADLIQEVIANACCAYSRLVERGKEDLAYATPLAMYAIRQVRAGRRVGNRLNMRDITSPYAQVMKGLVVERLDQFDDETFEWKEILVEDRRAGPAETAAARLDVAAWLRSLGRKKRRIAHMLTRAETTGKVARMLGIRQVA